MKIHDLLDPDLLARMFEQGMIRIQRHNTAPLAIYNYTEKAQFSKTWNTVTLNCRGLIVNTQTWKIVARPFSKFFNYGEPGDPWLAKGFDLDEPVEVTDKLDGSLGILYPPWFRDVWSIATRGSFHSDQAREANQLWIEKYHGKFTPPAGWTMLFEIVYPENRIVVDYGQKRDLVYLGAVDINSGATMGPGWPIDWPGPRAQVLPARTLKEALELPPRPGKEGIVVRFAYDDSRVKVKQQDYIELHKIVTGLNERAIWERCMNADLTLPPEVTRMDTVLEGIPDEFHKWARDVAESIVEDVKAGVLYSKSKFNRLVSQLPPALRENEQRGWFAKRMNKENWAPMWKTAFWLRLDQKHDKLREFMWKQARPEGTKEAKQ